MGGVTGGLGRQSGRQALASRRLCPLPSPMLFCHCHSKHGACFACCAPRTCSMISSGSLFSSSAAIADSWPSKMGTAQRDAGRGAAHSEALPPGPHASHAHLSHACTGQTPCRQHCSSAHPAAPQPHHPRHSSRSPTLPPPLTRLNGVADRPVVQRAVKGVHVVAVDVEADLAARTHLQIRGQGHSRRVSSARQQGGAVTHATHLVHTASTVCLVLTDNGRASRPAAAAHLLQQLHVLGLLIRAVLLEGAHKRVEASLHAAHCRRQTREAAFAQWCGPECRTTAQQAGWNVPCQQPCTLHACHRVQACNASCHPATCRT